MVRWSSKLPEERGLYIWRASKGSPPIFVAIEKAYGIEADGKPTLMISRGLTVSTKVRTPADIGGEWVGPIEEQEDSDVS